MRFRLWSTSHGTCGVRLFDADGRAVRTVPMTPVGESVYEAVVTGVGDGARYRFVLDDVEVNDPYARWLPGGIAEPAAVYTSRHVWRHPAVSRPLREHVIYELHLGTFTADGTYAAAARQLGALAELGITAVELLPVATFGGHHGWGYDGVAHYAPHPAYGTPDELREFVDHAHGLGLAVLMDVVYNHFGPAGNVLAQFSPQYFTRDFPTGWGDAPDFRERHMRRYVLDNVRMWLDDYRFDGLRFDAVHAIVDPSPKHILREISEVARAVDHPVLLIAEDDRNDPAIIEAHGFDAAWADDFHHAVHVAITSERDGYYACYEPATATIADAITRGWLYEGQVYPTTGEPRGKPATHLPAEAFVYCLQNHDQIGNRAFGDRLGAAADLDAYCAASALLLFLPMTPMLFMGQEWAASSPFLYFTDHDPELGALVSAGRREEFKRFRAFTDPDVRAAIPDPQAIGTFERSKLQWDERSKPGHARVLALYRELLYLRRTDAVLRTSTRDGMSVEVVGPLLVVRRQAGNSVRTLRVNLSAVPEPLVDAGRMVLATTPLTGNQLPARSAVITSSESRA